jgi:hypothetical protein
VEIPAPSVVSFVTVLIGYIYETIPASGELLLFCSVCERVTVMRTFLKVKFHFKKFVFDTRPIGSRRVDLYDTMTEK